MDDNDLYAGIAHETRERWEREARQMWGEDAVRASQEKARKLSKADVALIKTEMAAIRRDFIALFREGADPASDAAQAVTRRHHAWVSRSWIPDAEQFRGLGRLMVDHSEFRANYDEEAPGCAAFMAEAMTIYADRSM